MRTPYDFKDLTCIRKMNNGHFSRWLIMAELVYEKLDANPIISDIGFTPHNFSDHCYNIYSIISYVIFDEKIFDDYNMTYFSSEALFLLNTAVLFHDYSMAFSNRNRNTHSADSGETFKIFAKQQFEVLNISDEQIEIIKGIILAHSDTKKTDGTAENTLASICSNEQFSNVRINRHDINVVFLACVLRISDELDICKNRVRKDCRKELEDLITQYEKPQNLKKTGEELQALITDYTERETDEDLKNLGSAVQKLTALIAAEKITKEKKDIAESLRHWEKLQCFTEISDNHDDGAGHVFVNSSVYLMSDFFNTPQVSSSEDKIDINLINDIKERKESVREMIAEVINKCNSRFSEIFSKLGENERKLFRITKILPDFSKIRKEAIKAEREYIFYNYIVDVLFEYLEKQYPEVYEKLEKIGGKKQGVFKITDEIVCVDKVIKDDGRSEETDYKMYKSGFGYDFEYLDSIKSARLYDGRKYFCVNFDQATQKISVGKSAYFNVISNADKHIVNIIRFFPEHLFYLAPRYGELFEYDKYYDKCFAGKIKDWADILQKVIKDDFSSYCAGIGLNAFTVYNCNGEYKYLLCRGDQNKSTGQGNLHIAPAVMYEPGIISDETELGFKIFREFGKEIMGFPELEYASSRETYEDYERRNPKLASLFDGISGEKQNNNIEFVQTGFIFDIFHLRPAITFLLILNQEFSEEINLDGLARNQNRIVCRLNDKKAYQDLISHNRWVPEGIYSFETGRNEALREIGKQNADNLK